MTRIAPTAALALVALAPAANAQSSAAESPWSVTIEVGPRWNHDVSYTAFRNGTAAPAAASLWASNTDISMPLPPTDTAHEPPQDCAASSRWKKPWP